MIAKVSRGLGEAMVGINVDEHPGSRTGWPSAAGERHARAGRRLRRRHADRMSVIGVLALQGDVREHLRGPGRGCGAMARPVRRPASWTAVDGLVIPGGESTTMSKLAVDVRAARAARASGSPTGMPVYGSCAGMIMLADEVLDGRPDQQRFGGIDMTVRRNAFGRQVDSFEAAGRRSTGSTATVPRGLHPRAVGRGSAPGVEVLGRVSGRAGRR